MLTWGLDSDSMVLNNFSKYTKIKSQLFCRVRVENAQAVAHISANEVFWALLGMSFKFFVHWDVERGGHS